MEELCTGNSRPSITTKMESSIVLSQSLKCIKSLISTLRDEKTAQNTFIHYARRLTTVICEEGLANLEECYKDIELITPTKSSVIGKFLSVDEIVCVSIIRAGDSMLESFLSICPSAQVGKILIQRDEKSATPNLSYYKVPSLAGKQVILLDPMLATGGSAKAALKVLIENGAEPSRLAFFSVISCPEGLSAVNAAFPQVKMVTGHVDEGLNSQYYIVPGLGDYGDRYFGTDR